MQAATFAMEEEYFNYRYEDSDGWKNGTHRDSFRLITQCYRDEHGDIIITLKHERLSTVSSPYTTVSYTWGDQRPSHPIRINGKKFLLCENIWQFLNHWCDFPERDRLNEFLWIDSICINQEDIRDRNQQVGLMGSIYRSSTKVLIWLNGVSNDLLNFRDVDQIFSAGADGKTRIDRSKPASLHCLTQFERIVFHDYWQRLWIVQEIVLAPKALVILGHECKPLAALGREAIAWKDEIVSFKARYRQELYDDFSHCLLLYNHSMERPKSNAKYTGLLYSWTLQHLLTACKERACRDDRDRIYGVLGMWEKGYTFTIDYGSTKGDLAKRALAAMVDEARSRSTSDESWIEIDVNSLMRALRMSPSEFVSSTALMEHRSGQWWESIGDDEHNNYLILLEGLAWYDENHPRYPLGLLASPATLDRIVPEERDYWAKLCRNGYTEAQAFAFYCFKVHFKLNGCWVISDAMINRATLPYNRQAPAGWVCRCSQDDRENTDCPYFRWGEEFMVVFLEKQTQSLKRRRSSVSWTWIRSVGRKTMAWLREEEESDLV